MKKKDRFKQEKKKKFFTFKKTLLFLFLLIVALAIYSGISLFKWQSTALSLIQNKPSVVLDSSGKQIAEFGDERITGNVDYNEIPEDMKEAFVSIEDERFYSHKGIDIKRTGGATLNYIFRRSKSFGGSTITQQLVKNITGDNEKKISRKVTEWFRAIGLELVMSKDEILGAYLNNIYTAPNTYGVERAAKYYFSKNLKDLSLAECAFMAALNQSPKTYNPFVENANMEKINNRTKTVLKKMLELGKISEEEYNKAVQEVDNGLKFKKTDLSKKVSIDSYHTDALYLELIKDLKNQKGYSEALAKNMLTNGGLTIYSTQDSKIQNIIEQETSKSKYILKSTKNAGATSELAQVVMDQSNGYVVALVGGSGKKDKNLGLNRATQSLRQTGSSGKPISVLAPALEKKIITNSTIIKDELTTFDDGTEEGYTPIDYNSYKGDITVRRAVESSQNVPFVKIMEQLTPKESIKSMRNMGISTLVDEDENLNLALGGLKKGISPLEMCAAYSCIANGGRYIEPTFYTKVQDSNGRLVIKTKQDKHRAISKQVAYVLTELLTQPVKGKNGTATYCNMEGIEVAAKTGTTNNSYDRWLCGYTPYYTSVCWFGFDENETIRFSGKNPAGIIWANTMKRVHQDKSRAVFDKPITGVEECLICSKTGMRATDKCNDYYKEYFISGTVPSLCSLHPGAELTDSSHARSATDSTINDQADSYITDEAEATSDDVEEIIMNLPEKEIQEEEKEEPVVVENKITNTTIPQEQTNNVVIENTVTPEPVNTTPVDPVVPPEPVVEVPENSEDPEITT